MDKKIDISTLITVLRAATSAMPLPMSYTILAEYGDDPYLMLISCLLSLRTRDTVTLSVSRRLFALVRTPEQLLSLPIAELEKMLRPLGFFRRKTQIVRSVSAALIERFGGIVPSTRKELLSMKGVGRKTANLVLGMSFGVPAICVDTHVHRLANELAMVHTKTPRETEEQLECIVPQKNWIELNKLLVIWGQQVPRAEQKKRLLALLAEKRMGLKNQKSTTKSS